MPFLVLWSLVLLEPAASLRLTVEGAPSLWDQILSELRTVEDVSLSRSDCGFARDCPRFYHAASVNLTAQLQASSSEASGMYSAAQDKLHAAARAACVNNNSQVLASGGWCYDSNRSRLVNLTGKTGDAHYLLPAGHFQADVGFVAVLAERILMKPDGDCCYSLSDLGAGVGQLGHALRARLPKLEYYGYDAGGNVEEFTHNFVRFADLSRPVNFAPTDWVISSEVGEHIPHKFEAQFVTNLHAANCKGIVLTWARLEQDGIHHVNCHSNEYLKAVFSTLGYKFNQNISSLMRARVKTSPWLRLSTMVFERMSTPAHCAKKAVSH